MRRLKVAGQLSGGTTFIELDDVQVPVENLIGEEGKGMKYIMTNFNHERLTIAIGATRQARVALAAAFEYCLKREAFGKTLVEQPVVRHRLAKAGAMMEAQWAWIEQFVYQMIKLSKEEADVKLGGLTALAKAQAGIVLDECARCAILLFGGNGYTRTGQGELVESEFVSHHIGGGLGMCRLMFSNRNLQGRSRSSYTRWIRGRNARSCCEAVGQELSKPDQRTRTSERILEALKAENSEQATRSGRVSTNPHILSSSARSMRS